MDRSFPSLVNTHFDLLICGDGIYGAWTTCDAAQRESAECAAQIRYDAGP